MSTQRLGRWADLSGEEEWQEEKEEDSDRKVQHKKGASVHSKRSVG